jgi:hypothetical protein
MKVEKNVVYKEAVEEADSCEDLKKESKENEAKILIFDNIKKSPGMCANHCAKKGTRG